MTPQPLRIIQDSREQSPFRFEGFSAVVEVGTLEAGDYSIRGFERRIAVERKELGDLVGCLGTDRERFTRELARLRGYDAAAVVVESPSRDLRAGRYRAQMTPQAAWQTVLAFTQRFRVPFLFCDSRADAEQVTFDLLRHFCRDRARELEALRIFPTMALRQPEGRGPRVGTDRSPNAAQGRTEAASRTPPLPAAGTTTDTGSMGPLWGWQSSRFRVECGSSPIDGLKNRMRV